jgi:tetratricopeptide (TPR) repeat protein
MMGRHKASRVMAGKIFINYRRDDSISTAGRLHDRLAQTFGRENLFMDVDHIPAGVDFVDYLPSQVAACDVFLAVIGPNWLDAKDDDGRRRFDNPNDYVAVEIAAALARNIRVIPVLIDGARTPKADKLPDSIKPLVRRNAVEVRNTNFSHDAESLIPKIHEALKTARPVTRRWPFITRMVERSRARGHWRMVAGSATALLLVGWIGYQMGVPVWVPSMQRMQRAEQPLLKAPSAAEEATPPLSARVPAVVALTEAEAKRKADEAEQQRLAVAKAEEERKAKAAAEAEAKRKADEAEQQRLAAAKADEERKAKAAEAEQQRLAAAKAEEKRKAAEAERQRLAVAKAEEERRKQAEAEARARYSALVSQSSTAFDIGEYDKVISTATEAIRLDPKIADAFHIRARASGRNGDPDGAIADENEAIRLDPTDAHFFNNRGLNYARKRDYARAISDYNEAIRLDPNWAPAFFNRGVAYGYSDNVRAIADFREATRLNPNYASAFCSLGMAKLRAKQASGNADIAKARALNASSCR